MKYKNNNCQPAKNNNSLSLDKFFDDVFGNFEGIFGRDMNPVSHSMPHVNILETEQEFSLEIAAPGWSKSDFNISLDKNILTVEANKENENETKEGEKFVRREFVQRSLKRSFNLPEHVDKENISAKYINGVLTLGLPKLVETAVTQKIEIK